MREKTVPWLCERFVAPGATWDQCSRGEYKAVLKAGRVKTGMGTPFPAGPLGSFGLSRLGRPLAPLERDESPTLLAHVLASKPSERGTDATITLRLVAPRGRWRERDHSEYVLEMKGLQIGDVRSTFMAEGVLGRPQVRTKPRP